MKAVAIVLLAMTAASSAKAMSCDEAEFAAELDRKWKPQMLRAQNSVCATSDALVNMLQDTRNWMTACLRGQSRNDAIAEIDRRIRLARQTRIDAC